MIASDGINTNQMLKLNLFEDLTSKKYTLSELANKYSLTEKELFNWVKNLEININKIINSGTSVFKNVDDKSWTGMSLNNKKELIKQFSINSQDGTGTSYTIEELKKKKSDI